MDEMKIPPVIRLSSGVSFFAVQLIEDATRIELCDRVEKPNLLELYLDDLRTAIDGLEKVLADYEASRLAFVEIVHPDEHQAEIAEGAVSFAAFRDARGGA